MSTETYHALTKAPEPDAPLIFVFHGTGGDEHQFFDLAQQLYPGAGVVSPRGDVSEMGAARFFRRTGEGVYDMKDLARRTETMAAFVASHKAQHPDAPAYGFGYSNGANILASVAMTYPGLFARIGLLHPLIPWEPAANPALSGSQVLITAGKHDPICPWPLSQRLIDWFAAQGAEVSTHIHDGGHELRQPELSALQTLLTAP
ncbi:phospholipase/carboxylesterase [Pseudorhodobacter antarcticus]|uniref:Phospholipase/carboxylesterase n=1 Tax=Pseudorhodobacter antarcticus TaxID=1077947 RepID=A0A1H8L4T7_9RHOB|nr:alpha/beta hydrolase [Pseudorhodobacter antarcticus]SEN99688.1 phospholipase/carboxylesterase [Pseudorhodobacter antarcticus]